MACRESHYIFLLPQYSFRYNRDYLKTLLPKFDMYMLMKKGNDRTRQHISKCTSYYE